MVENLAEQEIKRVEEQLNSRMDRLENELRGEIKQIKDTLADQAVSQARNDATLNQLVGEVKSFRTEFMGLLTESIRNQQKQNQNWHDTAIKVLLAVAGAGGVFWAINQVAP